MTSRGILNRSLASTPNPTAHHRIGACMNLYTPLNSHRSLPLPSTATTEMLISHLTLHPQSERNGPR
ncbi:hypothetical protein VTJ04DRAFT_6216 [Mycothermus thermophilus]|uniref:uncharacterized protein n=1 Tax=Humicola insolens TaxID=85995 RepID=UPI0037445A0E